MSYIHGKEMRDGLCEEVGGEEERWVDDTEEKRRRRPIRHCCVPVDMINELE